MKIQANADYSGFAGGLAGGERRKYWLVRHKFMKTVFILFVCLIASGANAGSATAVDVVKCDSTTLVTDTSADLKVAAAFIADAEKQAADDARETQVKAAKIAAMEVTTSVEIWVASIGFSLLGLVLAILWFSRNAEITKT